jgi:hypothetical protein
MYIVNPKIEMEERQYVKNENEYNYDPCLTQEEIDVIVQDYYALED